MNKVRAFVLTSLCAANAYAIIGTFAMLKSPLSEEFGFSENFLGVLDGVTQIGTFLSSIWLIFIVIRRPKHFFFFTTCIQTLILMTMLLGMFVPEDLVPPFFIVLMLLLGMSKSVAFIPSYVLNQYFDWNQDKTWISIWGSILWMGDPLVIFLYNFTTSTLHWSWEAYVAIVCSVTWVASIFWEVMIEEIPPIQHTEEDRSLGEEVVHMASEVKRILSQWRYVFLVADYGIASVMYYNVLLWFPYYFTMLSFPEEAATISILYNVMGVAGALTFQAFIIKCERWSGLVANACVGMAVVVGGFMLHFSFAEQTSEIMTVYMILGAAQGFLTGGPVCRLNQCDLMTVTKGDNNDLYIVLVIVSAVKNLLSTICLYLIGFFLASNRSSFFWILLINVCLFFIADVAMRVYVSREDSTFQQSDHVSL